MQKRGISGITIIIILIALLLIAVVSSLILIETGFTLEQKAISTSDKASKHLSNKIVIDEVSSTFDSQGRLHDFQLIMQPLPSSERLDLTNLDLVIQTQNESIVLQYRPNGTTTEGNTGYSTWGLEEIGFLNSTQNFTLDIDYDDDGYDDYLQIDNAGRFVFNYSTAAPYTLQQVECLGAREFEFIELDVNDAQIESLLFSGYCGNLSLWNNVTFQIRPTRYGRGYYSIEYMQQVDRDHIDGKVSKGDIIKVYFETLEPIGLNNEITIILDPADGNPTEKRIYVPSQSHVGNIFFD
jgi:archaellin